MKKIIFAIFAYLFLINASNAQTSNAADEPNFKDKNIVHLGFSAQVIPVGDLPSLAGYAGIGIGLEHAVGQHWSYGLNASFNNGPTYDYFQKLQGSFRSRITSVGPEFRFYTKKQQQGLSLGLGLNYVQQRVLTDKLVNTNNVLVITQGGLNVNVLLGFQSQISKHIYARFNTGLGIIVLGENEFASLNIPFNLGLGYRF